METGAGTEVGPALGPRPACVSSGGLALSPAFDPRNVRSESSSQQNRAWGQQEVLPPEVHSKQQEEQTRPPPPDGGTPGCCRPIRRRLVPEGGGPASTEEHAELRASPPIPDRSGASEAFGRLWSSWCPPSVTQHHQHHQHHPSEAPGVRGQTTSSSIVLR